jgi:hypothetical protein
VTFLGRVGFAALRWARFGSVRFWLGFVGEGEKERGSSSISHPTAAEVSEQKKDRQASKQASKHWLLLLIRERAQYPALPCLPALLCPDLVSVIWRGGAGV